MFLVLPITAFLLSCRILRKEYVDWRRALRPLLYSAALPS